MSVATVHGILAASGSVTVLVSDRITPLERKEMTLPAVVLSEINIDPANTLSGAAGIDNHLVRVDAWAATYSEALAVAQACRTAIEGAGFLLSPSAPDAIDEFAALGGLSSVSYQYSIWV